MTLIKWNVGWTYDLVSLSYFLLLFHFPLNCFFGSKKKKQKNKKNKKKYLSPQGNFALSFTFAHNFRNFDSKTSWIRFIYHWNHCGTSNRSVPKPYHFTPGGLSFRFTFQFASILSPMQCTLQCTLAGTIIWNWPIFSHALHQTTLRMRKQKRTMFARIKATLTV